jgi:hypothetical protein
MTALHQVSDLVFHCGAGGLVAGFPDRVGLPGAASGQEVVVVADGDGAAGLGSDASGGSAGSTELGYGGVTLAGDRTEARGAPGRAGHRLRVEVEVELVLAEMPFHRDGGCTFSPYRCGVVQPCHMSVRVWEHLSGEPEASHHGTTAAQWPTRRNMVETACQGTARQYQYIALDGSHRLCGWPGTLVSLSGDLGTDSGRTGHLAVRRLRRIGCRRLFVLVVLFVNLLDNVFEEHHQPITFVESVSTARNSAASNP